MAKPDGVLVYVGTYSNEKLARDDYEIVKDLHAAGAVGTYDASVVTKDDNGKVHVNKDETSTRHGAWGGAAVGAVVGILFPPAVLGPRDRRCRHRGCGRPHVEGHVPFGRQGVRRTHRHGTGRAGSRRRINDRSGARQGRPEGGKAHRQRARQRGSKDIDKAVQEAAKEAS